MVLPGVCHGPVKSPPWLCKESFMALREIHQAGIMPVEAKARFHTRPILPRAMKDFSQIHDRLLLEPWRTPHRAMMDFSQTLRSYFQKHKNSKTSWKLSLNILFSTTTLTKIV